MTPEGKEPIERVVVAAVSGGPDSVYLLLGKLAREKGTRIVIGHVNYGTRGIESNKDQKLVENISKRYRYKIEILTSTIEAVAGKPKGGSVSSGNFPAGFEKKAREIRYRFLKDLAADVGAEAIALAHTADDQVETILMRVFEGAGIGGLKGIPRESADGVVRPILVVWKEDILEYLKKRKIPYRIDRSNVDTRFERNWVRHVLIPLLEKRYGKAVKKRIFTLGERFRELDDYLEGEAGRWIRRNVKGVQAARSAGAPRGKEKSGLAENDGVAFPRKSFSALPSVLRVKILQRICFDRLGVAPNERLLAAMDGNVTKGGPSGGVNAGKGWKLANRYDEALFLQRENGRDRKPAGSAPGKMPILMAAPGEYDIPPGRDGRTVSFAWEFGGKRTPAQAKRLAAKRDAEMFDAAGLKSPLAVRPLRAGDRIRPFAGSADRSTRGGEKKVKEILIDRKIPRDDRWGRPVLCDAEGAILWIPGVLRSGLAPVTPATRKTAILRIRSTK
ncbi:MAG: tRNA lysidine(34) synthetase TilS [Deltaproteobacteria bacterium]|nr:MAG: tRNA lysidine(34) synthetase TilS [Deltaproteobacteria bacterium]